MEQSEVLDFEGCNFFRQRLVYSLLSGRAISIVQIRSFDSEPGLKDFEMKMLNLMEQITNGTRVKINDTGTEVFFTPGMIQGGSVTVDGGTARCLSYYIEPLLMLAPFCKHKLQVTLQGVTNCLNEVSVDAIRATWLPVFNKFVVAGDSPEIKIVARGLKPDGGGRVLLTAPTVRTLRPVQFESPGKVCKIRGIAFVTKVSQSIAHRMIDAAKKTLRDYIADVYITVDQRKGTAGGSSPGFGLFLTAETTEGVFYHGEKISKAKGMDGNPTIPEEVGNAAASHLLDGIYNGGCLDATSQILAVTFMVLGERDVSKFLFGPLSAVCVYSLRDLKKFFEVVFKFDSWRKLQSEDNDVNMNLGSNDKVLLTCLGVGYTNFNKIIL